MPSSPSVLFICTGNICRSPAAEYLLRHELQSGASGAGVSSAGVAGLSGHPMDSRSIDYLHRHSVDGTGFTARRVNRRMLQDASLIVGFEQRHVDACLTMFPGALSRTFRLSQLAAWQRSRELRSLADLPVRLPTLPQVDTEHADPVDFTSVADYTRVLDSISADVSALATLCAVQD